MTEYINFTPDQYRAFKKRYNKAVKAKENSFMFEGREFVTAFAKYLLEYLETNPKIKNIK